MEEALKECDLILKGGVTSGVVYPKAIRKIGADYRLRSIGGTSAGSMAAALAAAAEYRRQKSGGTDQGGYDGFERIDQTLAEHMEDLLHPSAALAPVFDIIIDYLRQKQLGPDRRGVLKTIWKYYRMLKPYRKDAEPRALRNGGIVLGAGALGGLAVGSGALAGIGVAAGAVVFGVQTVLKIIRNIEAALKEHDYGLLPGTTTQSHRKMPGVIDWLADEIDRLAGNWQDGMPPDKPLTIGDLSPKHIDITLATVTTDLTSQRPFQLPLKVPNHYYFREEELNRVIPARVVRWMMQVSADTKQQITIEGRSETIYAVPVDGNFPVILCTRMSMSFPGLIQAVPLWRRDKEIGDWVRCLFSDGGISSNLPVHMFDAWLPRRPTFAITLAEYDAARQGADPADPQDVSNRVEFSDKPRDLLTYPSVKIDGLLSFLLYMFYSAKDWQDRLQSDLTGFDERVATIYLDKTQGGLNLNMKKPEIERLQRYGEYAGSLIVDTFRFDENRYRRALSFLPKLGENLQKVSQVMALTPPSQKGVVLKTFEEVLRTHKSADFPQTADWQKDVLLKFAEQLAALGQASETDRLKDGVLPHTDAKLSLTATPDLTAPKSSGQASGGGSGPIA